MIANKQITAHQELVPMTQWTVSGQPSCAFSQPSCAFSQPTCAELLHFSVHLKTVFVIVLGEGKIGHVHSLCGTTAFIRLEDNNKSQFQTKKINRTRERKLWLQQGFDLMSGVLTVSSYVLHRFFCWTLEYQRYRRAAFLQHTALTEPTTGFP